MTSESHPSAWKRFKRWLFGEEAEPVDKVETPGIAEEVFYRPTAQDSSVVALSKGDVYEFQVFADVEWSSRAMRYDELTRQAARYAPSALDDLRRRVWRIVRTFEPHEAEAAENAIRDEIGSWCYETDHGSMKCTPTVRVLPDPKVREHLTPYALRAITLEAEADLGHRRADVIEALVKRWREVLLELRVSPVTVGAAQLSDEGFARVLGQLADRRRASVLELVEVLRQATKDHEQLGMFEFAEMYATAIAAFRRQMEIEDSAFVEQMLDVDAAGRS